MEDGQKGLYRRVDVLGRVVIPKEVRKLLRINYGDVLEFKLQQGSVLMKKHTALIDIVDLLEPILQISQLDTTFTLFDTEKILFSEGKKVIGERLLTKEISQLLHYRKEQVISESNSSIKFFPIIIQGDLYGGFLLSNSNPQLLDSIGHNFQDFFIKYFGS